MSGEPIKNIIRILYDDLTSAVFSIIKTYQKRLRNELEAKLKEQGYEITNLDNSLGQLKNIGIIKIEDKSQQPQIKGGRKMLKQSMIKLYKYNGVDINSLKNKYEQMKKNMRNDLDERVKNKYICKKCGIQRDDNMASRTKFQCEVCKIPYSKNEEDISDLNKKCSIIFEVLDELFAEEENNSNYGASSNINNYLSSKYGKNFIGENRDTFEEDHDSYIYQTIENLPDKSKSNFYELVEGFLRSKKK